MRQDGSGNYLAVLSRNDQAMSHEVNCGRCTGGELAIEPMSTAGRKSLDLAQSLIRVQPLVTEIVQATGPEFEKFDIAAGPVNDRRNER